MKEPFRHIKGIASGTHCATEKLGFPFHTSEGCQGTAHDMGFQDTVDIRRSPTGNWLIPRICSVEKRSPQSTQPALWAASAGQGEPSSIRTSTTLVRMPVRLARSNRVHDPV